MLSGASSPGGADPKPPLQDRLAALGSMTELSLARERLNDDEVAVLVSMLPQTRLTSLCLSSTRQVAHCDRQR